MAAVFAGAFGLVGWFFGIQQLSDNSFLWHFRTGQLILDDGIPRSDPYSFTAPGVKWIAQSWLAELGYGVVDDLAGPFGVRVLIAVVGAALAVVMFLTANRICGDRLRALPLTALAVIGIMVVFSPRPLVFGLLAAAILAWIVELPESRLARHAIWIVPVLFWVWGNTHGTWTLGLVYVGLHLVGRIVETRAWVAGADRRLLIATLIGCAALTLNPYGVSLLVFPVELLGRSDVLDNVREWMSPNFRDTSGQVYMAWIAVVVVGWARRRPSTRDVVVGLPFLLLGMWAGRNIGVATIVTLPIAARAFAARARRGEARTPQNFVALAAVALLAILVTVDASRANDFDFERYSTEAYSALERDGMLGRRMFTTDSDAGYLILTRWPDQYVFSDDRFDMYPRRVLEDYDTLANVEPEYREVLDRWDVEVVVWPRERALSQALEDNPDWELYFEESEDDPSRQAVVFVRKPQPS